MFPGAFVKIPLLTTSLFSERGYNAGHYLRVNPSLHWKRKYFKNKLFKWGLQRPFNTLLQAFENDDAEDRRKLRINLQRSAQGLTLDNVFLVQYTRFGFIYLAWEGTVTLHPLCWHPKQLQPQGRFLAAKQKRAISCCDNTDRYFRRLDITALWELQGNEVQLRSTLSSGTK